MTLVCRTFKTYTLSQVSPDAEQSGGAASTLQIRLQVRSTEHGPGNYSSLQREQTLFLEQTRITLNPPFQLV